MLLKYKDVKTNAELRLLFGKHTFDRNFYGKDRKDKLLTIVWNRGDTQKAIIDEIEYEFRENTILPLMVNQTFHFENPQTLVAWQFNKDFYCIVNHDEEVGCVGFLFYGCCHSILIKLSEKDSQKIDILLQEFKDEFENEDDGQGEMLRMFLVRLIITITRLAKQQYTNPRLDDNSKFHLYRHFNLLVEINYKHHHDVQFYATKLNRSPKTLSNVFGLYGKHTPLQVIQDRIALEAKRLFYYTDKSSKEISEELGFDDASHFSRFFKNQTGQNPSEFKKAFAYINTEHMETVRE
jgi:AraC family transcriptional regulator, transcriptional activator of pobA